MKNQIQKRMISILLVLALVVGCFTVMPSTVSAATDYDTYDALLANVPTNRLDELEASAISTNGLNQPDYLWWGPTLDGSKTEVWILIRNSNNEKYATAAYIGDGPDKEASVIGFYADTPNKVWYSLIKFTLTDFIGIEYLSVSMGKKDDLGTFLNGEGNQINGNLYDYFAIYIIEYYKDDLTSNNYIDRSDPKQTTINAEIVLNEEQLVFKRPDGYNIGIQQGSIPFTIKAKTSSIIQVLYTPRTDLSYTVEYYYDNVINNAKTDTFEDQTFGTVISTYTDKVIDGYVLESDTAPITIGTGTNVIKVYYIKVIFTVTYDPGEHGLFEAVTYDDQYYGDPTPKFEGDLTNCELGWQFADWHPKLAATVTDDVTYVAQWKRTEYKIEFLLGNTNMGDKLVGTTLFDPVYFGDAMPIPPHPYAKFGYKFLGWQGSDGSYIVAPDYTDPTKLTGYPATVSGSVTYTAQWSLVNPKQTFPDKIPSETHFDQWWAEYGVLCVSSSTTKDGNYEVYFADWFFNVYDSCTIAFGANEKKFDYKIVFTKDTITLWNVNSGKEITNKDTLKLSPLECIRDGMHATKEKNHNYGLDFGMSGTLQGVCFVNPFGSGAKLAWLC
jgi:hypothetical protein